MGGEIPVPCEFLNTMIRLCDVTIPLFELLVNICTGITQWILRDKMVDGGQHTLGIDLET